MIKDREQLEYAISQYLDGTLNEFDRRVLEQRLETDAEARLLVSEYAHLDAVMRGSRTEAGVDFDRFGQHVCDLIAEEDSHVATPIKMPGAWLRYSAVAAVVVMAIGIGLHLMSTPAEVDPGVAGNIEVKVELVQQPEKTGTVSIVVGPSDQLLQAGYAQGLLDESLIVRTPKLVISAADHGPGVDDRLY